MQINGVGTFRLYTGVTSDGMNRNGMKAIDASPPIRSEQTPVSQGEQTAMPIKTLAQTAREKIDADYAKAAKQGTRVVADTANGGRHLDVSSLSDEELAAAAKGDGFTNDESLTAKAELAGRMWATLEPFEGNPRGSALAVRNLYTALSPAVRDALGWNEAMLQSGDAVIQNFGGQATSLERDSVLEKLTKALGAANALKVDPSSLNQRSTIDLTA